MRHRRSGAEELRIIVRNLDQCNETALDEFTSAELLAIGRAHLGGDWDIFPDQWSPRQLREAVAGVVPRFRESDRGFVPVHVGADGEYDGHCQRCDELNETDRACACPVESAAAAAAGAP